MLKFKTLVDEEILWVYTHSMPHLDEVVALNIVTMFGDRNFVNNFCRGDQDSKNNVLYLGVNGGFGDEHDVSGKPIKQSGECCATLIAQAVKDFPEEFEGILAFTLKNDTEGYSQDNGSDIASVLNLLHRQQPDNDSQLENLEWINWALSIKYLFDNDNDDFTIEHIAKIARKHEEDLDGILKIPIAIWLEKGKNAIAQGQKDFFVAIKEYKAKEKAGEILTRVIPGFGNNGKRKIKIVALRSDNYKMASAAKFIEGGGAHIVIIQNSKGQISVMSRGWPSLHEVASILRYEEQKKNGSVITTDWQELMSGGTVCGAECWYFDTKMNALLNGGFTHPEIPATKLSVKEVFAAVCIGLDKSNYRWTGCRNGKFCVYGKCPYYAWGLSRCKSTRYNLKNGSTEIAA